MASGNRTPKFHYSPIALYTHFHAKFDKYTRRLAHIFKQNSKSTQGYIYSLIHIFRQNLKSTKGYRLAHIYKQNLTSTQGYRLAHILKQNSKKSTQGCRLAHIFNQNLKSTQGLYKFSSKIQQVHKPFIHIF